MFSTKQRYFLSSLLNEINILSGVTGSGKSFIANLYFYRAIIRDIKNTNILLTGNTSETLYKNVIKELLLIDKGINHLKYTHSPARIITVSGNEVFCVGINNEGSDKRIKGGNVELWYADEVTTYPESSFDMCLSRCRGLDSNNQLVIKPAIMTCNPDTYLHYIKTRFLDGNPLNTNYYEFNFSDNPTMTQKYIDSMKVGFSGVFKERMIEGKWCGNTDILIIPEFNDEKAKELVQEFARPEYYDYYGALDPAFNDFTGYLTGYYDFMHNRYYIDGEIFVNKVGTPVIAEQIYSLEKRLYSDKQPYLRVSDTASQVIYDLSNLHNLQFSPTRKDDKEAALNYVRTLIIQNKLYIHPRCHNLIRQMKTGAWNKQKTEFERNEKDGHYDLIDALIYLMRNIDRFKNPFPKYAKDIMTSPDVFIPDQNRINKSELAKVLLNEN